MRASEKELAAAKELFLSLGQGWTELDSNAIAIPKTEVARCLVTSGLCEGRFVIDILGEHVELQIDLIGQAEHMINELCMEFNGKKARVRSVFWVRPSRLGEEVREQIDAGNHDAFDRIYGDEYSRPNARLSDRRDQLVIANTVGNVVGNQFGGTNVGVVNYFASAPNHANSGANDANSRKKYPAGLEGINDDVRGVVDAKWESPDEPLNRLAKRICDAKSVGSVLARIRKLRSENRVVLPNAN